MTKVITLTLFIFSAFLLSGQDHFLVEFEKVSPPIQDLITHFEGSKAMQFMAPDVKGQEQFLGNYKGKKVIIWFWSKDDGISLGQLDALNLLQSRYRDELQVLSFASESKSDVLEFIKVYPVDFPVMYNGSMLGEAAYGGDLGLGRLFFVDKTGTIIDVLPREVFEQGIDTYGTLESVLTKI